MYIWLVRELVGIKTRGNNKSCKLKQIQVISVRSAGVAFKVTQSLGTSRYSGPAQHSIQSGFFGDQMLLKIYCDKIQYSDS